MLIARGALLSVRVFHYGMVSVPKFPPIPRLSIVIPIGRDLAAFESTLISVLENRPEGCEILVAHDGSYADPFDLCDEVRFVTAPTDDFSDLVSTSASIALGRFVHIVSDGITATPGWVDSALEQFERHDAGVVVPVIRSRTTGQVMAAGWRDSVARLCQRSAAGQQELDARSITSIGGCYLQASFWRRDLLRSLRDTLEAFPGDTEASYVSAHLVEDAGWRHVVASECTLNCDRDTLPWESSSLRRGRRLRAIQAHFSDRNRSALVCATKAMLAGILNPSTYAEALGQAFAGWSASELNETLEQLDVVSSNPHEVIMKLPTQRDEVIRRAA